MDKCLNDNINDLEEDLVIQVLQSHGLIDKCIYFAQKKKHHEMIIMHYLNEENYADALSQIAHLDSL
jgi:hypothetical protein